MDRQPKILVTGGAGFVGSHCCKALASAGCLPVTFDDLSHGYEDAVRWGPLVVGNILDANALDQVMAEHQPIAIMHFASFIAVGESVVDPGKYYRNNVVGSMALLEAAHRHDIRSFVFSSSAAVYGLPEEVPIQENSPIAPINPYGRTKAIVEAMLADFEVSHGLKWSALRYFNAAGADPEGDLGERHDPETHLIPLALAACSGTGAKLTIFGDDYDTADGTCIRDYIHVTDLADAHVVALKRLLDGGQSISVNLGTGEGHSVRDILNSCERVTGCAVPHVMGPRRAGDPPILVAAPDLAERELGWKAKRRDLDAIVGDAWRWKSR